MAIDLHYFPGYKDGDEKLSVAETDDYVGGMALRFVADGMAATGADDTNFAGVALNDREADATNGKAGYAPRGTKATLKPSYSPTLDKLIVSKGVSAGQGSFGESNLAAFAKSLDTYGSNAPGDRNPTQGSMSPTDLGATKKYPYDETKTYTAGELLFVNATSGKWTNVSGDSTSGAAHGQVVKKEGDNLTAIFF
jgi:hypothetical protein